MGIYRISLCKKNFFYEIANELIILAGPTMLIKVDAEQVNYCNKFDKLIGTKLP